MTEKRERPIVAIDGPSGSGKSTVSKAVADELGFTYINTGAMYRCVALLCGRAKLPCEETPVLESLLNDIQIQFDGPAGSQKVLCNGEDVSGLIYAHDISKLASDFSALPMVRRKLVAMQREMGNQGGVVMEGRDIGSNVFPDAEVKVFLDASPEVRAKRRFDELNAQGKDVNYQQILDDETRRDRHDIMRSLNPLRKADGAVVVDSSELNIQEVTRLVCNIVNKKE